MCFISPPLHPTCFPSVCLIPSLPCLCVCYLTLRYARNSTSLLFLPWQLGCMYTPTPHPPLSHSPSFLSLMLQTLPFFKTSTAEKNYNKTPKLRKWIQSVFCFIIELKNNSDLLQLGSRFLGFGHHLPYIAYENIVLTMCHDLRNYFGENNSQLCFFKATLINIFILGKNQMVKCNVKGVAHIDKPTENHHPTAIFLSCRWWLSTQCFGFTACNLFGSISMISSTSFPDKAGSCYQHKKL